MSLEVVFGSIYVVSGALSMWSMGRLNRFLATTQSIADEACLERLKSLARMQMFLALAALALLIPGMIIGMVLVVKHGVLGLAAVIGVNVVILGIGRYHKTVEVKARSLPASSEALGEEYRRVCETWVKKALPDF